MSAPATTQADSQKQLVVSGSWGIVSRLIFRFCFLYFSLFCVLTQILGGLFPIPGIDIPEVSHLSPFRQIVFWTARNMFGYRQPLVFQGSGSGDKVFDWVLAFCLLIFSVAITLVWSATQRTPKNYDRLYAGFHILIRFALASTLFVYGLVKILPMQMPFPFLSRLSSDTATFLQWVSSGRLSVHLRPTKHSPAVQNCWQGCC